MKYLNFTKKNQLLAIVLSVLLVGCSGANKNDVKDNANQVWSDAGFEVKGYEGYQWGLNGAFGYGGAKVWYIVEKKNSDKVTYHGYIQKWGDEYHIYSLKAIDALKAN